MGRNLSPTKDDVRAILDSVGDEVEEDQMAMLFKAVEGKDITELIAAGREKLAFTPCGPVNAAAPAAAASGGASPAGEEEEKVEEKAEEEDDDAMFSLFDD